MLNVNRLYLVAGLGLLLNLALIITAVMGNDYFFGSCNPLSENQILYQTAIRKTKFPVPGTAYYNLWPVPVPGKDSMVQVICLKSFSVADAMVAGAQKNPPDTLKFETWIALKAQMDYWIRNSFRSADSKGDTLLRLEQLLGLPPTGTPRKFVVMQVPYKSIFRPCINSGISDRDFQNEPRYQYCKRGSSVLVYRRT